MFNLIMAGNDSGWDVPLNTPHHETFLLSRFLEYTDPTIAAGLKPVSAEKLAFLEQLPAVFLSELDRDENGNAIFRIRLGNVSNLSVVAGEIHYTFQLTNNYGSVQVEDREAFRKAFRMDAFELHRTHWAIKSADLAAAMQVVTAQVPAVAIVQTPQPPQPGQQPDITEMDSLDAYMGHVLGLTEEPGEEIFYRGHSSFKYLLAPSLFRTNRRGAYTYLPKEEIMVREILSVQDAQFSNDRSMLDRLVRMQHFGLPTRLLDVSSNPLVALYFACSQIEKDEAGNELDGEVIVLRTPSADVLHFDSDRVSCIANLSLMKEVTCSPELSSL